MFMAKEGDYWGGSRDYNLPSVPCLVSICPCNRRGKCEMPSKINIGGDGRCKTGIEFMEEAKNNKVSNKTIKNKIVKKSHNG